MICLLVLIGFSSTAFAFQTSITSNQNIYKRVSGGAQIGTDFVIVDNLVDFDKFGAGDTVLVIQMKGLMATVQEAVTYGTAQDALGSPGYYEFLIVQSTDVPTRKITFRNNLSRDYDVNGDVQIVRVPYYNSAVVESTLTCQAWDTVSKTGGVLTMIVGKRLTLNADIDVSGKGFLGGAIYAGNGICVETDVLNLSGYSYPASNNNSGFKGGSIVTKAWIDPFTQYPIYPAYAKGKGANFNGGGGGNGRFSGGGGGSNYGAGGRGGRESTDLCTSNYDGGLPGRQIKNTGLAGGIYLGGGGGGSTSGGGTGSDGGHGGGIVIIICNDIVGNNHAIKANGEHPAINATGLAGAGGGGAGGSIAIYLEAFSTVSNLIVSANGGQGGNNSGTFGEGGGGGGGLIWISNVSVPANVTRTVSGGAKGSGGSTTSIAGAPGESLTTYVPVLNGFLFNSIRSSVTNDLTDSICSNVIPAPIMGTVPVGGSGSYTYLWQRKNDSGGAPVNIPSSNVQNFTFTAPEADTFFIRRVVKDDVTILTDTSKWVKIIVQPAIQFNNIVSIPDTICFNADPQILQQEGTDLFVPTNKYLYYLWQSSTDYGLNWSAADTLGKEYDPPAGLPLGSTLFRRTVISGRCIDMSGLENIIVLPLIENNAIVQATDTICFGGNTDLATIAGPTGGLPTDYRYQWEYSMTGLNGSWSPVAGETSASYDPDLTVPLAVGNHYYRRKVFSGEQDACRDSSSSVLRKVWPVLTGNTIAADQTIGYDSIPDLLTATATMGAGDGVNYSFLWIRDTLTYPDAYGPNPIGQNSYQPPNMRWTASFMRVAFSSACTDTSNSVKITVHAPIVNTISLQVPTLDTIYFGQDPGKIMGAIPSGGSGIADDYSYKWYKAVVDDTPGEGNWVMITDSVRMHLNPGILTQTTWFRRDVSSPAVNPTSTYRSNLVKVVVLPLLQNFNISTGSVICAEFSPPVITGNPALSGGDGNYIYTWQDSTSTQPWQDIAGFVKTGSADFAPPVLTLDRWYRRITYSGKLDCASEISNISYIKVNPLPIGVVTSVLPPDTICENASKQVEVSISGSLTPDWSVILQEKHKGGSRDIPVTQVQGVQSFAVTPDYSAIINDSTEFTYRLVSIRDANGCYAKAMTGSRKLVVYEMPESVVPADGAVCGPEFTITATPSAGTGTWYKISGSSAVTFDPDINSPVVKVTIDSTSAWVDENIYTFKWKEVNWQCKDSASLSVKFYKWTGIADAGGDRPLYSFTHTTILQAKEFIAGTGTWDPPPPGVRIETLNDTTAFAQGLDPGNSYVFTWKIENGECKSNTDQFTITSYEIIVPQGFSPNGDGINDELEIEGVDIDYEVNEVIFRVFNSAGSEVFFTTNAPGNTWTNWTGLGKGDNMLPDGTYYYRLIIKQRINLDKVIPDEDRTGYIILKRSVY